MSRLIFIYYHLKIGVFIVFLFTCRRSLYICIYFYCTLGFGIHVQNMQDSCIGTHMAVWFAAFLPFTHIWHFSLCYPSPTPSLLSLPYFPQKTPVCSALLPVSMCSHCSSPAYEWEHAVFGFLFLCHLLRMMVSRLVHVPTKDTNSLFFIAA